MKAERVVTIFAADGVVPLRLTAETRDDLVWLEALAKGKGLRVVTTTTSPERISVTVVIEGMGHRVLRRVEEVMGEATTAAKTKGDGTK